MPKPKIIYQLRTVDLAASDSEIADAITFPSELYHTLEDAKLAAETEHAALWDEDDVEYVPLKWERPDQNWVGTDSDEPDGMQWVIEASFIRVVPKATVKGNKVTINRRTYTLKPPADCGEGWTVHFGASEYASPDFPTKASAIGWLRLHSMGGAL